MLPGNFLLFARWISVPPFLSVGTRFDSNTIAGKLTVRVGEEGEFLRKDEMAKIDLDAMSIEDLATLRDDAATKLLEKVTARQLELEAEIERLAQYGKPGKM